MKIEEHNLSDIPSPLGLAQLSVGLVSSFVLDYQHLVCFGVVRRLINTWLRGPLSCRLPARKVLVSSPLFPPPILPVSPLIYLPSTVPGETTWPPDACH